MKKKNHDRSPDKKGFSIALPISLIDRIQEIANDETRSRNKQIEHFLEKAVKQWKLSNTAPLSVHPKQEDNEQAS